MPDGCLQHNETSQAKNCPQTFPCGICWSQQCHRVGELRAEFSLLIMELGIMK